MIDEGEILHAAANLKVKLLKRGDRMMTIGMQILEATAGKRRMNAELLQTMQGQLLTAQERQKSEGTVYATLRWVLGAAPDIDPDDLELDK